MSNNGATGGWSVTEVAKVLHVSARTVARWIDALQPEMACLVRIGRNGRRIVPMAVVNTLSYDYGRWQDWNTLNQ